MAKVLFIEDNPTWQNIVKRILNTAGHETSGAGTFETAIDILNSKIIFDVIIFDLNLGDGFVVSEDPFIWLDALIQGLQSRKIEVPPIIIVTGVEIAKRQIIRSFTQYRDYVFSFFEKAEFDAKEFLSCIKDAAERRANSSVPKVSIFKIIFYAFFMVLIALLIFGGLLFSVQRIPDPSTQKSFLQIGGGLIVVILLFTIALSKSVKIDDIISSVIKIWRK